jgi:hypothetical protein
MENNFAGTANRLKSYSKNFLGRAVALLIGLGVVSNSILIIFCLIFQIDLPPLLSS